MVRGNKIPIFIFASLLNGVTSQRKEIAFQETFFPSRVDAIFGGLRWSGSKQKVTEYHFLL